MDKNKLKGFIRPAIMTAVYVLAVGIGFGAGRATSVVPQPPEIKIDEPLMPLNNTEILTLTQSDPPPPAPAAKSLDCSGKIKGNIGSGGTKIYHVPGGSFFKRTTPEMCFDTEAEAQAAGFRKSSK